MSGRASLRVWWIPQVPMQPFFVHVANIDEGRKLLEVLAAYDAFQYEHNVKPDYSNAGGLAWRHPDLTEDEWWDFDPEDKDECAEICAALAPFHDSEKEGGT